ncbi:hypothetical protein QJQ45_004054 [Haematococcus lacustris]|nr:hypothetical protein QJQ45_004054 [Haematococcus lacustris]
MVAVAVVSSKVQAGLAHAHQACRLEPPGKAVAPRILPQPPCSQGTPQPATSEPGPSTVPQAERSKRTKAEQAAESMRPNKGKGKAKGKAAEAKPAPQPGRWLDRDCNAALNMQRNGESRWRPLELCWLPNLPEVPAKSKEYLGLGYKRLQDQPPAAAAAAACCGTVVYVPPLELYSARNKCMFVMPALGYSPTTWARQ